MRRDLCYFYPVPVIPVFDAFVQAANRKFGKNCRIDAYKTISFGLDYSFRYNMNGGSLTLHFMPYNNGTAVDMHYTIVQAFGARYQKHADDVLIFVNAVLQAQAQPINLDINQFLTYEATGSVAVPIQSQPQQPVNTAPVHQSVQQPVPSAQPVQQPVPTAQPVPSAQPVQQPAPAKRFCSNCGAPIVVNAAFCTNCGSKLS